MKRPFLHLLVASLTFLFGVTAAKWVACSPPVSWLTEKRAKENLSVMRQMIDQYAADRGILPSSLDDLVRAGYLREVPVDPLTKKKDWQVEIGEAIISDTSYWGVVDVRSNAQGKDSDGRSYSQY